MLYTYNGYSGAASVDSDRFAVFGEVINLQSEVKFIHINYRKEMND
jgi:hypothetical protein